MIVLSSAAGLLSGFVVRSHNCHRSVMAGPQPQGTLVRANTVVGNRSSMDGGPGDDVPGTFADCTR